MSVQSRSYLDRNNNISELPSVSATTLTGSFTEYKPNWTFNSVVRTAILTLIHRGIRTRPKKSTWWFLTQRASVKALRISVIKQESKFTLRGEIQSRIC